MLKKVYFLIIICVTSGISLCGNFEIGSVHSVSGDVTLFSKSKAVPLRKALPGRLIHEGDRIDTGKNGICQVIYSDGNSFIRVKENSQVEFSSAGLSDIIDLNFGSLYCQIGGTGEDSFKIYSSIGHYLTSNSRFWLESHHNQSDEIIVQSGVVLANNQFSMKNAELDQGDAALLYATGILNADKYDEIKFQYLQKESRELANSMSPFIKKSEISILKNSDLIPVYLSEQPILGKNILSFKNYRYQFGQTAEGSSFLNVIPYFHRQDLKIGLSFPIIFGGRGFWDFDKFFYDLLDRIEYLDYYDSEKNLNVHLGNIQEKTYGHGGLIHNYRNTHNKLADKRTGLDFSWSIGKKFVTMSGFVASMRDLSRGGGLMGCRAEMFMMDKFPMTLGLGIVVDHNEFAEIPRKYVAELIKDKWKNEKRRRISGMEIDATYEFVRGVNRQLNGWVEFDYLYFSDTISYKRNLPTRKKTGTSSLRTGVDFRSGGLTGTVAFIVDAPIMLSPFFTPSYDLERSRNIKFTEDLYQHIDDLSDSTYCGLCSYSLIEIEDSSRLVPRELFSVISQTQNVYTTPGMALKMNWSFNDYGSFGFDYGLKMEIKDNEYYEIEQNLGADDESFSYDRKLFHTLHLEGRLGEKVMVGVSELTFLYSQYNSPSFFGFGDVFTTSAMGIRIGLRPMQFMRLIIDMEMIHYDIDFDGVIDAASSINMELRFSI